MLLDLINNNTPKKEIMKTLGIKGDGTLMKRLQSLQQKKGEVFSIVGFGSSDDCVRFSGPSIIIHNSKLDGSPFSSGDNFTLSWTSEEITLTRN